MLKSLTVAGERFRIKYLPEPTMYFRENGVTEPCDAVVDLDRHSITVAHCEPGYPTTRRLRAVVKEINGRLMPMLNRL